MLDKVVGIIFYKDLLSISVHRELIVHCYYLLADTINNAAGFGFQGYDKNGEENWDLVSNLNIKKIEVSRAMGKKFPSIKIYWLTSIG